MIKDETKNSVFHQTRKVEFFKKFDDPAVFDCAYDNKTINLIKVVQDGLVVDYTYPCPPRDMTSWPTWILAKYFKLRGELNKSKQHQLTKKMATMKLCSHLFFEVDRFQIDNHYQKRSVHYDRFINLIGRENICYIFNVHGDKPEICDFSFDEIYKAFVYQTLDPIALSLLRGLAHTLNQIEKNCRFSKMK